MKTATSSRSGGTRRVASAASTSDMPAERLIEAAVALFAQHGFDAVSTGAIAKAAGLTQSMVHYHFGTKDKLWKAAIVHIMRVRGARFSTNMEDLRDIDPLSRLKIIVRRFVSANAADADLTRILIHEGMNATPRLKWLARHYMAVGYRAFDDAIEAAMASGAIRRLPVADVTNIIVGACALTFTHSRLLKEIYGEAPTSAEAISSYSDTLLEILFNGLATEPGSAPAD